MRTRTIGGTGLAVTEAAFGGGPLGGLFRAVSSDDAQAALEAAWEAGIRTFDTAPHYGIGRSEREMGAFLRAKPRRCSIRRSRRSYWGCAPPPR